MIIVIYFTYLMMSKEELILTLKDVLNENDENKIILLINSAIAYVNWYTLQDYSFSSLESIPYDVLMVVINLVSVKYHEKVWVESERLADYSISYSKDDLTMDDKFLLNKYIIYSIE